MGAPLGARHRVYLVEDHPSDRSQYPAGLAGEDQVQGLGGGDEDVRGMPLHASPVGRRGVPGADGRRHFGEWGHSVAGRGMDDSGQRRP